MKITRFLALIFALGGGATAAHAQPATVPYPLGVQIQSTGAPVITRWAGMVKLNFTGGGCVWNAGLARVDCTLSGGGSGGGITTPTTYSAGTTYPQYALVNSAGVLYQSLQAANTGNTPASSPTYWSPIAMAAGGVLTVASRTGNVVLAKADITDFPTTWAYSSLTGVPTTFAPTAATASAIGGVQLAVGQTSTVLSKVATTNAYSDLTGVPTLVPVATSGSATDLTTGTLAAARFPAFTGDCTTASGAVALTCTKTNGTLFAPSATTDTTNASNITSGTLAAARVAILNQNTTGTSANVTGIVAYANGGTGSSAAPLSGQLLVGNAGGTAYSPVTVAGDCTLTNVGAIVCTKTNGTAFATSATTDTTNATNITSGTLPVARLDLSSPPTIGGTTANSGKFTTLAASGALTSTNSSALSTPAVAISGTWISGGTATTTTPHTLIQPTGATAVTSWKTGGTALGINALSTPGAFIDLHTNGGGSLFLVDGNGTLIAGVAPDVPGVNSQSGLNRMTFSGTTGAATAFNTPITTVGYQNTGASAASTPAFLDTGTLFGGGTATTTTPHWYINQGATAPTSWSTSGTMFGMNAVSGFNGNFLDFHLNGAASGFLVTYQGNVVANYMSATAGFNSAGSRAIMDYQLGSQAGRFIATGAFTSSYGTLQLISMTSNGTLGATLSILGNATANTGTATFNGEYISTVAAGASYRGVLYTPATSATTCVAGDFAEDANYHYVCTAANTWKRIPLGAETAITSATTAIPLGYTLVSVTLSANYTPTMAAGWPGDRTCIQYIEGGSGAFTVTSPSTVLGFSGMTTGAGNRFKQCYTYSGTTGAVGWGADGPGINF